MAVSVESVRPRSIPLPLIVREDPSPGFLERKQRILPLAQHPNVIKSIDYEQNAVFSVETTIDEDDSIVLEEHEIRRALAKNGLSINGSDGMRFKIKEVDGKMVISSTDLIEAQYEGSILAERKLRTLLKLRDTLAKDPEILRDEFVNKSEEYRDALIDISPAQETYVIFVSRRERHPDPKVIDKTPFKVILAQIPEAA